MNWYTVGAGFLVGVIVGFLVASRLFSAMRDDFFKSLNTSPEDK